MGKKFSKAAGYIGGCDKRRVSIPFWAKSPVLKKQKLSKELKELSTLNNNAKKMLANHDEAISEAKVVKTGLIKEILEAE